MQHFSTEQIRQDRKSDTDKTLKHPPNFRIKHSMLTPDHISPNFIYKLSLCVEPGQESADQVFSDLDALDSVITAKSKSGSSSLKGLSEN